MPVKRSALPAIVALVVALSMVPAPVSAVEDPRFVTTVSEPRLSPGADQVLTVQLTNDDEEVDDRVKTASAIRVEAAAGETPFQVLSGPEDLGSLADGESTDVSIELGVPVDAPAGEYRVPLSVTYEFDGDERETTTVYATAIVPERPVFEITDVATSVRIGERGSVAITLKNNGSATAGDTRITVESPNPSLTLEGAQSGTESVGDLDPGTNRTVDFAVSTTGDASNRNYTMSVLPTYVNEDGVERTAPGLSFGVSPEPRQTFEVEDPEVTPTDDTLTLRADLTNTGNSTVYDAVATLSTESSTVRVTESTAAAGRIEPGESGPITFELRVPSDFSSSSNRFVIDVRYDRPDDRTYQASPVSFTATVPRTTDALELEPINNTFDIDETNRFDVRVTNTGDEPLHDVHARLAVAAPYTSAGPTSYVESLSPGESAVLTFEVTTPEDAVATTDAIPVVVNATGPDDRIVSTGPEPVQIVIQSPDDPTDSTRNLAIGGVAVVLVLVAGWWWLNR